MINPENFSPSLVIIGKTILNIFSLLSFITCYYFHDLLVILIILDEHVLLWTLKSPTSITIHVQNVWDFGVLNAQTISSQFFYLFLNIYIKYQVHLFYSMIYYLQNYLRESINLSKKVTYKSIFFVWKAAVTIYWP